MAERGVVLLVDDDVTETAMRSILYQKEGFITLTALCGEVALRLCEQMPIQLAVLDVEMPECNGIELARKIRSLGCLVPIVIHSGTHQVDWQSVADAFVPKGTAVSVLMDLSKKLLKRR